MEQAGPDAGSSARTRSGSHPSPAPQAGWRGRRARAALIGRYAAGKRVSFAEVPLDLAGVDAFRLAIYEAARQLGFGETTTYGGLASAAGHPGEARETGQALGQNPVPIIVPCHRILAAGNKIGGFSAPGGAATKARLLGMEGVRTGPPAATQSSFGF